MIRTVTKPVGAVLVTLLILAGCSTDEVNVTPATFDVPGRVKPVPLPFITSQAELAHLADIFAQACIDGLAADKARFTAVAKANGFSVIVDNGEGIKLTNGRAELRWGQVSSTVCSVSMRLPSDDAALEELQRVVTSRKLASGPPKDTGLLGAGYIAPDTSFIISLGRDSLDSPTSIRVLTGININRD